MKSIIQNMIKKMFESSLVFGKKSSQIEKIYIFQ